MRRFSAVLLAGALALANGMVPVRAAGPDATATGSPAAEPARVIVRFKANADSVRARLMTRGMTRSEVMDVAQTRAHALGLRTGLGAATGVLGGRSLDERTQVIMVSGQSSAALAARLARDAEVESVSIDYRRRHASVQQPNDPLYGGVTPAPVTNTGLGGIPDRVIDQWYLKAPSGDVASSINAPGAWSSTTGSSSVIVAVLDTGVRKDHPDLAGQFIGGYDMIAAAATAGDGDGRDADASDPGDFVLQSDVGVVSGCDASDVDSSSWHGTRVSGLIAALTDNNVGMAGLAYGTRILPVRVLGKCGGFDSDIMAGMLWAAGIDVPGVPHNPNKAAVLNMSLGGSGACSSDYARTVSQVLAAGVSIVAAAGNGIDSGGVAAGVPANCSGVISVGALRHVGTKVGFANLGTDVTISAPGGNCINVLSGQPCLYPIVSLTNSGTTTPVPNSAADTGNTSSVGTSFSTPLVVGTVALMKSVNPNLTPAQVMNLLKGTARTFVTTGGTAGTATCLPPKSVGQLECYCTNSTCGAGMLDAAAAVSAAMDAASGTVTVTAASPSVTAGQTDAVTVTSTLPSGRTAAGTAWSIVSGPASVSGSGNSATVTTTGAGTVVVQALVTDDLGVTRTGQASITVTAAAAVEPPAATGGGDGGGGGGGGAFSPVWLVALSLACVALAGRKKSAACKR